jgi:hypothetical protein
MPKAKRASSSARAEPKSPIAATPASAAKRTSGAKPAKPSGPRYSVILPTYNEADNLPLMMGLLDEAFSSQCVACAYIPN